MGSDDINCVYVQLIGQRQLENRRVTRENYFYTLIRYLGRYFRVDVGDDKITRGKAMSGEDKQKRPLAKISRNFILLGRVHRHMAERSARISLYILGAICITTNYNFSTRRGCYCKHKFYSTKRLCYRYYSGKISICARNKITRKRTR